MMKKFRYISTLMICFSLPYESNAWSIKPLINTCKRINEAYINRVEKPVQLFMRRYPKTSILLCTTSLLTMFGFLLYRDRNFYAQYLLAKGVKEKKVWMLKFAKKLGADIDKIDNRTGLSILHEASCSNDGELVKVLLKAGARINMQDKNGSTRLILALHHNHLNLAQELVNANADVNIENRAGLTPLHLAVSKKRSFNIVENLIKKGAASNTTDYVHRCTPLHYAVWFGRRKNVKALCKTNAHIDSQNKIGATPLMIAVSRGFSAICQKLIDHGANPSAKLDNGVSVDQLTQNQEILEIIYRAQLKRKSLSLWSRH